MRPKSKSPQSDRPGQATRVLNTPTGTIERILITTAISIAIILASLASAYGAAVGQITGTILDKETGKPVVGATVLIVGTTRGAMSDFDGKFLIRQVEPGLYTLRISHLDYKTIDVKDVSVEVDHSVELATAKLEKLIGPLDKQIVVQSSPEILEVFEVSDQASTTKESVDRKPVTTVDELLKEVKGTVIDSGGKVFIRGGRAGEVSYTIQDAGPLFLDAKLVSDSSEIQMRHSTSRRTAFGSLTGVIIDSATGDPIPGATVRVLGSTNGAVADGNGVFLVKGISIGNCDLRAGAIGYLNKDFADVPIRRGETTNLGTIALTPLTTGKLDEKITVVGDRDILEVFEVSNQPTISKEPVEHKPVTTVDELLTQVPKPVTNTKGEVYIRGGRSGEVSYVIDGKSIGDPLGGLGQAGKTQSELPMRPRYPVPPNYDDHPRFDGMTFQDYGVNPWTDTRRDYQSTFAADVDDASFIMTRSYLERGHLPPADAVRTEEFINHFHYDYDGSFRETFRVYVEGATSPFAPEVDLIRIGIKGREVPEHHRDDANLVFVIDRSGSMQRENRIQLVKDALRMLLGQLRPNDRIAIVAFDTRAEIILRPTFVRDKWEIQHAIERIYANGSTNVDHGLKLGYELANKMFTRGKINRVMLLSDGVANTGRTQADQILARIKRFADKGITLTTVGVGMGNYNDELLEKLGNKGNGGYAYVDSRDEAHRIFVEKLTGTLQVIARDVKIQVTFNPQVVASYRLLGYENRDVADHKFRDDREDGGEVGAGHEVTAIYQVQYQRRTRSNEIGTVAIRYKDPDHPERVHEINGEITRRHIQRNFDRTSDFFQLAAVGAEFAEILRQVNAWPGHASLAELEHRASDLAWRMESPQAEELANLIRLARQHGDHLADW